MSKRHSLTAIIYDKKGRVLSVGQNNYVKTHPLQKKHAEVSAIVKCTNLAKAYRISIFRFNVDGTPAVSKPCPVCLSAIRAAGIERIEHT